MTTEQRSGLVSLMNSILACKCCPPDIRMRAENLLQRLLPERSNAFANIFGGARP